MKPFKTLGSLALCASSLLLVVSCSKSVDEQFAKGDNEVGKFSAPPCQPFVGIQTKTSDAANTFVFYGTVPGPSATQAFYGSDFSLSNLLAITATGGTPYHRADWNYIGVTDEWVDGSEVLSLKLSGTLAGKAANKMKMQMRGVGLAGSADFYLGGVWVGALPLSSTPAQQVLFYEYEAVGNLSDFDEVRFSVTAGRVALTGYTPNTMGGGASGFYLVEAPGNAVVGRFKLGTTVIDGMPRPNQYFTYETGYNSPAPAIERQNRLSGAAGDFPPGQWVGAKHWVNIWGMDGMTPMPLGWGTAIPAQMRLGVSNSLITGAEMIVITPGADFPNGGSSAYMRAVQVRQASITGAKILVKAWMGATLVGWATSSGVDASYVLVAPGVNFNKVTIESTGGGTDASVGRIDPGPISANIKLYPSCP